MSIARHHAEWLSLVEVSGPFLSMPVLLDAFPQGLEAHDPDLNRFLRLAHDEWENKSDDPATHNAWIRTILKRMLDYPADALLEGQAIPPTLQAEVAEQHEIIRPSLVLKDPATNKPRVLIHTYPAEQGLTKPVPGLSWKASPDTRMAELLHATGVRLGLVTNGERWMLVDAPRGETTGFASWYATLWVEEPVTFRAFRSLLGQKRLFGVAEGETLEALLTKSAANQQEVTDQLGYQVRKAVEVLIQSLDRADQDHSRELLKGVSEAELYEAALTVMMRLVFLFCAEERELIPDPAFRQFYDENLAASTLREELRAVADQHGEEVLERRHDAWSRLLTLCRAVYGGVYHDQFTLIGYGGRLFDPDRFPFLEGRKRDTSWRDTPASPLPVNNRTVLHLLEALQILRVKVPGGGPAEARRLSFRALDIEQIGHVYEGLLDHTAKRAAEPYLGLAGAKDQEPEVPLAKLEETKTKDENDLLKFLKAETGRSESALKKALKADFDAQEVNRFRATCQGDEALWQRVQPFAGLVRPDTCDYPVVIPKGCVFVTQGTDRRSSGTHYTPRSLTEPIVQYTLEPLVYDGPAEGLPKDQWKLKSARELLDLKICDMACGSGAFLVQACRYLAERLVEAWEKAEKAAQPGRQGKLFDESQPVKGTAVQITPFGMPSVGGLYEQIVPADLNERVAYARRIVAQRCLYGVDKNPLAVEMAKLSLWLLTLAKDKPFEFLDHAIRCGDSLVGIHDLRQLRHFNLDPKATSGLFEGPLEKWVDEAVALRQKLEGMPSNTVEDVQAQEKLLAEAEEKTARLRCAADLLVSVEFQSVNAADKQSLHDSMAIQAAHYVENGTIEEFRQAVRKVLKGQPTFHWPLEFPEVFTHRGGFDALVGNPPFVGGKRITGLLGTAYRDYLVAQLANGAKGHADYVAYFFLRSAELLSPSGLFGLVATSTLTEGDTREVGLDQLRSMAFFRATSKHKWPGGATLEIVELWASRRSWSGPRFIDDELVGQISSFLSSENIADQIPHRLGQNAQKSFIGNQVHGSGFVLTLHEFDQLIATDPNNREVVFPYINGQDLNSSPTLSPGRYVISFSDMPLRRTPGQSESGKVAEDYPHCLRIVTEKVKPERDQYKRKQYREKWWQHAEKCLNLYRAIAPLRRVLLRALTGKHHAFAFVPKAMIFDQTAPVFAFEDDASFSILQSDIHMIWWLKFAATLGTTLRYAPTDCFETFPFPERRDRLADCGQVYHTIRSTIMSDNKEGLTKTYNRFHNRTGEDGAVQQLRELHVEMDKAVAAAYGWTDLNLGHDFHETKQGLRFTISESARREVLARLLKLNHERYADEVKKGLHEKKKPKVKKTRSVESASGTLFE